MGKIQNTINSAKLFINKPLDNKTSPERDVNFDLLKIVTVFFIIFCNLYTICGFGANSSSYNYIISRILYLICKSAINLYVLVSAYYLCTKNFSFTKIIKIWGLTIFYSLIFYFISIALGYLPIDAEMAKAFFPVFTSQNKFITAFILLYILMPFLNHIIRNITMPQHLFLTILVIIISILSTELKIFTALPLSDGNNVVWFCCLYLIASFIRIYNLDVKKIFWPLFVVTVIGLIALMYFNFLTSQLSSPAILIISIIIFMFFKTIDLSGLRISKYISALSTFAFTSILIEEHFAVQNFLYKYIYNSQANFQSKYAVLIMFGFSIVTFIGCVLVEDFRRNIIRFANFFITRKLAKNHKKDDPILLSEPTKID